MTLTIWFISSTINFRGLVDLYRIILHFLSYKIPIVMDDLKMMNSFVIGTKMATVKDKLRKTNANTNYSNQMIRVC